MPKHNLKLSKKIIFEELSKFDASDIMVPRSEVVMLKNKESFANIIDIVTSDGHSRFPVYKNQVDNIIGILYVKDLLKFFKTMEVQFDISKIIRKPLFVSENKKASELLTEFRETRIHMAIVVNEYGTMVGIVSLEDILEEIVGDISDEFDKEESQNVVLLTKDEYLLSPKLEIEEFNKIFKTRLISDDYETIGGFLIDRFGFVPKTGETMNYGNYHFEIIESIGSRIFKIKLKKI